LKKVIGKLKAENKHVHVLDIGTGTGLLSMMAVACGADKVTAVEAFKPMIQVAKNCLKSNGMHEKVKIIEKRSTEIIFGVDMLEKANVLVTEVFDTELIGEGAISTFTHALENLLEKDCHVIPDHGFMYVQVVDSEICRDLNWLNKDGINLKIPKGDERLSGDFIYDIQLTEFNKFKGIIDPTMIFK
jgi:protein arginine N-methyltransferase 7